MITYKVNVTLNTTDIMNVPHGIEMSINLETSLSVTIARPGPR